MNCAGLFANFVEQSAFIFYLFLMIYSNYMTGSQTQNWCVGSHTLATTPLEPRIGFNIVNILI